MFIRGPILALWLLAALVAVLETVGCTLGNQPVTEHLIQPQALTVPQGIYWDVAWITPNMLVVTYKQSRDERVNLLWQIQTDGENFQMLDLPKSEQECLGNDFYAPRAVRDGQMTFVRSCVQLNYPGEQNILRWSATDKKVELLRPYPLPTQYLKTSFAPDLSRWIVGTDTSIRDDLYWLNDDSAERIDIGFDRATEVAWSPDNKNIVFFGNKSVSGAPGPAWAGKPYDLWMMPANCDTLQGGCKENITQLVSNVHNQTAVNWSPNSRWIVFDGDLQGRGQGLWLRNMQSGEIIQIQKGRFRNPSFSPDGKSIVAIGQPSGQDQALPETTQLYLLDVHEIVSK